MHNNKNYVFPDNKISFKYWKFRQLIFIFELRKPKRREIETKYDEYKKNNKNKEAKKSKEALA